MTSNREGFNMPLIINTFRGNIEASKGEILDEDQWIIVNPADWTKDEIEQVYKYFVEKKGGEYPVLLGKWDEGDMSSWASYMGVEPGSLRHSVRWVGFRLYPHFYYDFDDVRKWPSLDDMLNAFQ